jgi:copper resistance protein C
VQNFCVRVQLRFKESAGGGTASTLTVTRKVLALFSLALSIAPPMSAHAVLVAATPAVNGTVTGPDVKIHLRFNARIDSARSRLRLVLPDQSVHAVPVTQQTDPATLDSQVTGLLHGTYRLQWQVLAGDGHITRGEVPFQVK